MFLLALTVMTFYYVITEACQCSYVHPQDRFCMSDFSVGIKIKKIDQVTVLNNGRRFLTTPVGFGSAKNLQSYPQEIRYTVIVKEVFKQKDESIRKGKAFIYTPKFTGCDVTLSAGEYYIITGQLDSGRLFVPSCTEVVHFPRNENNEHTKKQLQRRELYKYKYNLACGKCSFCWDEDCYQTPKRNRPKNQCRLPKKWHIKWRKSLDSVCLPKSNGRCSRKDLDNIKVVDSVCLRRKYKCF